MAKGLIVTMLAEVLTKLNTEKFYKYQEQAARGLMREAAKKFVQAAVERIPIRTGFVRGAFSALEQELGAGGGITKIGALSRKISHHEETLRKHKENLARTQADILSVPPKSSSAGEKGVDLEKELHKKLSKITKQYREGNISKARYQQKKEEAREEIFKKASAQKDNPTGKSKNNYSSEYGREKGFEKGGKVQASAEEKRIKLLTKLQKAEAFHNQRISKLESRLSDLRGRASKFTEGHAELAALASQRSKALSPPEARQYTSKELHDEREGIRKSIKDKERAPLNALGLVEYYNTGSGTKILKTFRSGTAFSKFDFQYVRDHYSFTFEVDISYFNVQDVTTNRWSGPSAPWRAMEIGRKAMKEFLENAQFGKKLLKALFIGGFIQRTRFVLSSQGIKRQDIPLR